MNARALLSLTLSLRVSKLGTLCFQLQDTIRQQQQQQQLKGKEENFAMLCAHTEKAE